jgi:hypothetical protein
VVELRTVRARNPFTVGMTGSARLAVALTAVTLGLATALFRLLALVGFPNDQFVSLTRAAQILVGEWPVRDFVEPGAPLTTLTSAAVQAIGGRTLLSEALLVAAALCIAAARTMVVVAHGTGSWLLGAWATVTEIVAFPRPYGYPKILLYVAAAGLFMWYARAPRPARLVALAGLGATAFLVRHDHGVYIGAGALAVTAVVHARDGFAHVLKACAVFTALLALLLAPYLLYVQVNGGLISYVTTGLEVSRVEAARTLQGVPDPRAFPWGDPDQHAAILYWLFWAIVPITAVVAFVYRRVLPACAPSVLAGLIVMTAGANSGFLRDPLDARIPDAIVGPVLLLAAASTILGRSGGGVRQRVALAAILLVMAYTTGAAARVGRFTEQVDRTDIGHGLGAVAERAREVVRELKAPYAEHQMPSDFAYALVPFYVYVRACTPADARLLVTGFAPEVPYYAGRGFAGGHVTLYAGFHASAVEQEQTIARLERQLVPFVVVPPNRFAEFERLYQDVAAHVARHYTPLTDVPVDGFEQPSRIFVRRDLEPTGEYGPQRWPCFN